LNSSERQPATSPRGDDSLLGLTVREYDAAFARRLEIPSSVHGVVVARVEPARASFVPSIRRGFIITEINRQPVRSVADFQRMVSAARSGEALAFYGYDPALGQRAFVIATVDETR
jgi:serine protease Do